MSISVGWAGGGWCDWRGLLCSPLYLWVSLTPGRVYGLGWYHGLTEENGLSRRGGRHRRLGVQASPTLPEHHEVTDSSAHGRRVRVRPHVVHGRLWPGGSFGSRRPEGPGGGRELKRPRLLLTVLLLTFTLCIVCIVCIVSPVSSSCCTRHIIRTSY